jgi:hypothetical protein
MLHTSNATPREVVKTALPLLLLVYGCRYGDG